MEGSLQIQVQPLKGSRQPVTVIQVFDAARQQLPATIILARLYTLARICPARATSAPAEGHDLPGKRGYNRRRSGSRGCTSARRLCISRMEKNR
jgi:hypothetical protein